MKKLIELKKEFTTKGVEREDSHQSRGTIIHTQLHYEENVGYIYSVNYDGNIHFLSFKERHFEMADVISVVFPGDYQFANGDAINFLNLQDAMNQLNEWKYERN
jgi:hypothetical protein